MIAKWVTRTFAAAVLALSLAGCVYEPAGYAAYPAYPAAVYPAPVYGPTVYGPPAYGTFSLGFGEGWGHRHWHHWR